MTMKDLTILFLVLFGLIIMFVIIFAEIVETLGDLREGDRYKNRAKELLGNNDTYEDLHAFLHDRLTDSVIEFRERWEKEGRSVTETDELAFTEGMESGTNITMSLMIEILRKL